MTIDRASVEEGARLAAEATKGEWDSSSDGLVALYHGRGEDGPGEMIGGFERWQDAAFIAHWNPEFAAEVVAELRRLWRVEEAAERARKEMWKHRHEVWCADYDEACAALANPAAEVGRG